MKTVTFCGHREIDGGADALRKWLMATVNHLILHGAELFYLGGYGAFDRMAASVVNELRQAHDFPVEAVLVLAYPDRVPHIANYDRTTYPPLETVPRRFAILKRNEWMVEHSDVVVAYVHYTWGGAAKTLEYAQRKGKEIIRYRD